MSNNVIKNLFDKLTEIIESANESVWTFAAVILPYISPITTAVLTTASLKARLELDDRLAWLFAGVLELVGVLATSFFVHAFLGYIKSRNPKVKGMLWFLGLLNLSYVLALLSINALLSYLNNEDLGNTFVISICVLFLSWEVLFMGITNWLWKTSMRDRKRRNCKIRLDRKSVRTDLKSKALKAGINVFALDTVTPDAPTTQAEIKIKHASDYKEHAFEMLDGDMEE